MKAVLAQLNPTVGDVAGNTARLRSAIVSAVEASADLVVFGELSILGYPVRDLLYDPALVAANVAAMESLAPLCQGIAALVGFARPAPEGPGQPLEDAAALLADGGVRAVHVKSLLPNYDVYDDPRYFRPGGAARPQGADSARGPADGIIVHEIARERLAVTICEDLWDPTALGRNLYGTDPIARLAEADLDLILNIAASGYERGKGRRREALLARQARRAGATILYVNQVGGNDDMIFDGGTSAVGPSGDVIARAAAFREDLLIVDTEAGGRCEPLGDESARLVSALELGLGDYVRKGDFRGAVVGLTGDAASATVAILAARAIGPEGVLGLDLRCLARNDNAAVPIEALAHALGIRLRAVEAGAAGEAMRRAVETALAGETSADAGADVAAHAVGALVAACARATGRLPLSAATKTDLALGWPAADAAPGALAPLGDVFESESRLLVADLAGGAALPNGLGVAIPTGDRSDETDAVLRLCIEQGRSADEIAAEGHDRQAVLRTLRRVDGAEYRRKAAPTVLKVTAKAFGPGRRMPVARRYEGNAGKA